MNSARIATLLTVFFAFLCIIQVSLIAQTLDRTRAQLSSRSTGAINSLTQIDRNLDQLMSALLSSRFKALNNTATENADDYQSAFEIFWASVTVLNLRSPGSMETMPAATALLQETDSYLKSYDILVNGDSQMTNAQTFEMFKDTIEISEKFHELGHDYFLALSIFSDELKDRTKQLYQTFLALALMVITCGSFSLYLLFKANRKSEELIEKSNATQARLTQVVDELRSGKLENKAKDSFLAAASHDLRQPLHALGLFLGALEQHVHPTGRTIMQKAQESSTALNRLLSSLLDLSRLDAGTVKVQRRHFDLGKLVETLRNEFQPTASLRQMTLNFDETEHMVFCDRVLIDRVLRNLIENALTHSRGTRLELRTSINAGQLFLAVADDGIGIPVDKQQDIFSEYYQIGNPERDRSKGLGIGLAIVHRLSEMLDIDLQLYSRHNAGCTFTFKIPLSPALDTEQSSLLQRSNRLNAPHSITVGVIEDEQEVRDGMEVMLDSKGYTALSSESADKLIQLVRQEQKLPDVIVSDYRLRHGTTGDQAIEKVLTALNADVPSVIITGDTSPARVKELNEGGYKLMHKPVDPADLLAMIETLAAGANRMSAIESKESTKQ